MSIPLDQVVVGAVVVTGLGFCVECVMKLSTKDMHPETPFGFSKDEWIKVVGEPGKPVKGGGAIGMLERLLFFGCFLASAYILVGAWLAFKLGAKWETWNNIVRVSDYFGPNSGKAGLIARRQLGSWVNARLLIGVLLNLTIALFGAYVAKHYCGWIHYLCKWTVT